VKIPTVPLKLKAAAELELRRREKLRAVLSLREYIKRVNPRFRFYSHLDKLISTLQRVADGDIKRLMVFMPPRHGKSETVSRLFTGYFLYRYPDRWSALTSYASELASTLSRAARDNYLTAGGAINQDVTSVKHWETGKGGGMWATGVGGPATGKGFHLGVIDDPVKNAEDAASETLREHHKNWYRSTFSTREEPGGAIVLIMTRWNERDLAGWLLAQEAGNDDEPERWHIINMPAIAEIDSIPFPATCTIEHDDRLPGEPLCVERYPLPKLKAIERRLGPYFWASLFQQRPAPREGGMFKRAWFSIVHALPVGCQFVRYWDKAGSQGKGAFSAGVLMARTPANRYITVDVKRGQWSATEREAIVFQTAQMDAQRYGDVSIWAEQEPGSGGKESAENTVRNLAGYSIRTETVTGDKVTRADPFSAQAGAGNVDILLGDWNEPYLDELASFPNGTFKDQVDGSSGAFNKLALGSPLFL
jgi:predicted phage terminase large subunit-like protein